MPKDNSTEIKELQTTVQTLTSTVKELQSKIEDVKNEPIKLDRYLDNESKQIINDVIEERIINIVWNDYFYYSTWFDGIDGFSADVGVTINPTGVGGIVFSTTGIGTGFENIAKINSVVDTVLDFTKESRFRSNFRIGSSTDQVFWIAAGDLNTDSYGFKISNTLIYGFSKDTSGTTTVLLGTIAAATTYNIEAHFVPGARVSFIIDDVNSGSVFSNLPKTISSTDILWSAQLDQNAAAVKTAYLNMFEYIQKK